MVAPLLFERLPCRTTTLCFEVDGTFPNHEANPLIEENRRDIVERVDRGEGATSASRGTATPTACFFIDGTGEFIAGDFVTALLAEAFLIKHPGAKIVYDVRASYAVKDIVAKYGGTALMNRVGHAFFKRRMREENAIFGGEVTGPLLLPRQLLRRQRLHPGAADPRADVAQGPDAAPSCWRRCARSTSSRARSTRKVGDMRDGAGEDRRRSPRGTPTGSVYTMDGVSVGVPRLALQRARVEHRAAAPAEPRGDDARR